jgi:hypothetical protein
LRAEEWDELLANLGGHPLQSALWGDARRAADGTLDLRLAAFDGPLPILMARVEVRRRYGLGPIAWVPRGPVSSHRETARHAYREFLEHLKRRGFMVAVDEPADELRAHETGSTYPIGARAKTLLLNLTVGRDAVWAGLHKEWRYGVRLAARSGVQLEERGDEDTLRRFFNVYAEVSEQKGFERYGSLELMQALLKGSRQSIGSHLFVAMADGEIAAGGLVIRCGKRMHQMWSAVDRRFRKQRPAEAVRWAEIEWAVSQGLAEYDLEGFDEKENPGTYAFKKRSGAVPADRNQMLAHPNTMFATALLGLWARLRVT